MNKEQYYRRTYNAIETLRKSYKDGYNEKTYYDFCKNMFGKSINVIGEERISVVLTIAATLLGLNKERIERTGKHSDYKNIIDEFDIRKFPLKKSFKNAIKEFENRNTMETGYENFLSVIDNKDPNFDKSDCIKAIRNAFMHSQYELVEKNGFYTTKIKNKNYFEGELINENFIYFVMSYFGNLPKLGLTEKYILYAGDTGLPLIDDESLKEFLSDVEVNLIRTTSDKSYDGENTFEKRFVDKHVDKRYEKDEFEIILKGFEKDGITFDRENFKVDKKTQDIVFELIKKEYGDSYYSFNQDKKINIIYLFFEYVYENARNISNWLVHYYYAFMKGLAADMSFFTNDEYLNFSNEMSILILKAYLILFRIQSPYFNDIDYELLDIDINELVLISYEDGNVADLFNKDINKLKNKENNVYTDSEIEKIVINNNIRDSLAHGNVSTFFDYDVNNEIKHYIKLENIYENKNRVIKMDIDSFRKYLDSEAFLPRNSYDKTKIIK